MRYSPKGAMCDECQELNALHSSVVDGASIRIPERLTNVPTTKDAESSEPFVLDVLHEDATAFEEEFSQRHADRTGMGQITPDVAESIIVNLLSSEKMAISEYETVVNAATLARLHGIDLIRFVSHIDFSALSIAEKHAVSTILNVTAAQAPYIWNRYSSFHVALRLYFKFSPA